MRARESFSSGPIYVIRQALRLNEVAAGRKVLARKIPPEGQPSQVYDTPTQARGSRRLTSAPWPIGATDVVRTFLDLVGRSRSDRAAPARRQPMMHRRPAGFIQPCLPSRAVRLPSGPLWVHEIKHDGYRLMVRRDGPRVRCFTKNGYDWAARFPAIVDAALRLKAQSFLIDGEAVIPRADGMSNFRALRSRASHDAVLFAFDLLLHEDDDLRDLALISRKQRLARLIGKAKRSAIRFVSI